MLRDEILLACREWDALLSALVMVCLTLILMPVIHFSSKVGGDALDDSTGNNDDAALLFLQGTDLHYYLRDIFNMTVGICACYLALSETASLTNECERCLEVVLCLHKSKPWLPPLQGHCALRDFMCSQQYSAYFGFTIMGTKIENKHLATFGYAIVCIFSAVGGNAASSR